jgi:hypothetical protein
VASQRQGLEIKPEIMQAIVDLVRESRTRILANAKGKPGYEWVKQSCERDIQKITWLLTSIQTHTDILRAIRHTSSGYNNGINHSIIRITPNDNRFKSGDGLLLANLKTNNQQDHSSKQNINLGELAKDLERFYHVLTQFTQHHGLHQYPRKQKEDPLTLSRKIREALLNEVMITPESWG